MDQERRLARGEFEELKDRQKALFIEIHALTCEVNRNVPVPDLMSKDEDIAAMDTEAAKSLLKRLQELQEEYKAICARIKELSGKWEF
ncbi:hypothetical protein KKA53_04940 [Candidatus Dependentiae bacterium]|nr:hypothetical protein [Candidatus Dependentiae bacterium]